jgi:hypothetical protein
MLGTSRGKAMDLTLIEATAIILVVIAISGHGVRSQLRKIEAKLNEQTDCDDLVDQQVNESSNGIPKRREKLESEKRGLPRIDLCEISGNRNWEPALIAGAEKLRHLIADAFGNNPDSHFVDSEAREVPMDYFLAHAALAHVKVDLNLKEADWAIKKSELLGAMRKSQPSLSAMVGDEFDLREIEREIEKLRQALPASEYKVWEAFTKVRSRESRARARLISGVDARGHTMTAKEPRQSIASIDTLIA